MSAAKKSMQNFENYLLYCTEFIVKAIFAFRIGLIKLYIFRLKSILQNNYTWKYTMHTTYAKWFQCIKIYINYQI